MGATLPVLVGSASVRGGFGQASGRLYGWNTLGAVCGALSAEFVLVDRERMEGAAGSQRG